MDSDLIELSSSLSETNIFGGGLECLTCPAARYYFPAHTLTGSVTSILFACFLPPLMIESDTVVWQSASPTPNSHFNHVKQLFRSTSLGTSHSALA